MQLSDKFTVPVIYKDMEQQPTGSYTIVNAPEEGIVICGTTITKIFQLPIGIVGIVPLDEEMQLAIEDYPFDIEKHQLVYQVSFNNKAWYFIDIQEAYALLDTLLRIKVAALHQKFIEDHSGESNAAL